MHPVVFSAAWFARHQRVLLGLINLPIIGGELRDALAMRRCDLGGDTQRKIVALYPHAYTVANEDGTRTTDFRTHRKYAKRLRHQFDAVWRAAHAWDRFVANPLVPVLNLGFDTLTVYPDPDPETTSVDGYVGRFVATESWATIHDAAAGNASEDSTTTFLCRIGASAVVNTWAELTRQITLFDTNALGAAASISSAEVSIFGNSKNNTGGTSPTTDVYTSNPASTTALVSEDYDTLGSTSLSDAPISFAAWDASGYNTFTLNAVGRSAIATTGITKLGQRIGNYDAPNIEPTWSAGAWTDGYNNLPADWVGSANDPKLVITFSNVRGAPTFHPTVMRYRRDSRQ